MRLEFCQTNDVIVLYKDLNSKKMGAKLRIVWERYYCLKILMLCYLLKI
jgi:hypothetical protein